MESTFAIASRQLLGGSGAYFDGEMCDCKEGFAIDQKTQVPSCSSSLLSSLELRDANVYEPWIRALFGTASQFSEVVVLKTQIPSGSRIRAKRQQLPRVEGLSLESQGQNLALTVLHVPYSLDGACFIQTISVIANDRFVIDQKAAGPLLFNLHKIYKFALQKSIPAQIR